MHVTDRIKRAKLGGCSTWGTCPTKKIFDFRLEIAFGGVLVVFGVKQHKSWTG